MLSLTPTCPSSFSRGCASPSSWVLFLRGGSSRSDRVTLVLKVRVTTSPTALHGTPGPGLHVRGTLLLPTRLPLAPVARRVRGTNQSGPRSLASGTRTLRYPNLRLTLSFCASETLSMTLHQVRDAQGLRPWPFPTPRAQSRQGSESWAYHVGIATAAGSVASRNLR